MWKGLYKMYTEKQLFSMSGWVFFILIYNKFRCSECPENCVKCYTHNHEIENVDCHTCKNGYYLRLSNQCSECPSKCKICKSETKTTENLRCETCMVGFYLHSKNNTDRCICHDGYYLSENKCIECPNGRWGHECKFSCIPCSGCVSDVCTRECLTKSGTAYCQHPQSTCHHECSKGFIGQQKSDASTTNTVPTTISARTERILPKFTTMQRQLTVTLTTIEPLQTPTSNITPSIIEDGTTLKAEAESNGSVVPVLYIVIAVLAGLVLTGVLAVVIVCVKWRKQTRCCDEEVSPHNTNKEAKSLKLTDNARENININNHENVINAAESNTGYVDMNNIDTIASINVAENNTGSLAMNASGYVNIGNKTAMTATDTSNAYEALSQYTNVRDAENQYTAISGNESVYYSVPN